MTEKRSKLPLLTLLVGLFCVAAIFTMTNLFMDYLFAPLVHEKNDRKIILASMPQQGSAHLSCRMDIESHGNQRAVRHTEEWEFLIDFEKATTSLSEIMQVGDFNFSSTTRYGSSGRRQSEHTIGFVNFRVTELDCVARPSCKEHYVLNIYREKIIEGEGYRLTGSYVDRDGTRRRLHGICKRENGEGALY